MAWRDTLLDCSFRDVVFDVVGTRDSYGRAVSVSEVPYVDGGTVEDLGGRPVRYSLQAVFFGDDYEDRLFEALDAFNAAGPGELVHPVLGVIQMAQCVSVEVAHSAPEPDACTVTLEFVESGAPIKFFEDAGAEQVQFAVGAQGDTALERAAAALTEIVNAIRTAEPLATLAELRQAMLGPLLGFVGEVQGVVLSGLDVLDEPRAWTRDVAALSNGVVAIASFGDNLMGDWRAITGVFSRVGAAYGYGSSASAGAVVTVSPWSAGAGPTEAQCMAVAKLWLTVNNATAQADVAAIVLAAEASTPTLSPDEIDLLLAGARTEIELAITLARATLPLEQSRQIAEPLKDQALVLQSAGRAIIERRPPLLTRTLEAAGNLRLIAHLWYGDHRRAPELARLNNLRYPNALQPGDTLHAYAR